MTRAESHDASRKILGRLMLGLSVFAAAVGVDTLLSGGGTVHSAFGALLAVAIAVEGVSLVRSPTDDARLAALRRTFEEPCAAPALAVCGASPRGLPSRDYSKVRTTWAERETRRLAR